MPALTIVMPAYNEERYVAQAVRSVLAQTMGDFELIAVDDGSSDKTGEVIGEFDDERIRLISPGKIGKVAAFNLAVAAARGEWFYFMGADDVMRRSALESWSKLVAGYDPRRNIACRARLEMISDNRKYHGLQLPKGSRVRNFSGPLTLLSVGMMERVVPIPEDLPNEDTWWSLCIDHFAEEVIFTDQVVISYRVHGGNAIARNSGFRTFSEKYHTRQTAITKFLAKHSRLLSRDALERLESKIHLEELRYQGQLSRILACRNVNFREKARALSFASPQIYRTKKLLDRWVLGH